MWYIKYCKYPNLFVVLCVVSQGELLELYPTVASLPIRYSVIVALTGLPIGYSVIVALTGLPIGYSVIVALTGLSIGYSVILIVALTGLPIGYSVIVALIGLPIGYSTITTLTGLPPLHTRGVVLVVGTQLMEAVKLSLLVVSHWSC